MRHERVTSLLMMRDAGMTLPEDVDLCLEQIDRMETTLRREHNNGHLKMAEFCPICQASPKTQS